MSNDRPPFLDDPDACRRIARQLAAVLSRIEQDYDMSEEERLKRKLLGTETRAAEELRKLARERRRLFQDAIDMVRADHREALDRLADS